MSIRKIWMALAAVALVLVIISFVKSSSTTTSTSKSTSQATSKSGITSAVSLPKDLTFVNERVPLEHFDVHESLDREIHVNTYFQSQTIFYIKRSARFFPTIERILKENNVPDDFKYLAVAESGLANVVSPSDAAGFWQFLKGTAIELGLEVNDQVDERFNLDKSTFAACKYLKKLHDQYGSWTMAAAAYNSGPNGLMKNVERQKENNYYNLYLNEETARYVFRILAIKLIIETPSDYGFDIKKSELYRPFTYNEVTVDSTITSIADFAALYQTNYKILKILNPWLRDNTLTNKTKKTYTLKIPTKNMRNLLYDENDSTQNNQASNEKN